MHNHQVSHRLNLADFRLVSLAVSLVTSLRVILLRNPAVSRGESHRLNRADFRLVCRLQSRVLSRRRNPPRNELGDLRVNLLRSLQTSLQENLADSHLQGLLDDQVRSRQFSLLVSHRIGHHQNPQAS